MSERFALYKTSSAHASILACPCLQICILNEQTADGHSVCACATRCVVLGVSAGMHWRGVPCKMAVLFARGFVLFLDIIVFFVEAELRHLWKKMTDG